MMLHTNLCSRRPVNKTYGERTSIIPLHAIILHLFYYILWPTWDGFVFPCVIKCVLFLLQITYTCKNSRKKPKQASLNNPIADFRRFRLYVGYKLVLTVNGHSSALDRSDLNRSVFQKYFILN